jgi:hypothetical protein
MTTLTKCPGSLNDKQCPMRETCLRYREPAFAGHTSFPQAPMYQLSKGGRWKCDEYWKVASG